MPLLKAQDSLTALEDGNKRFLSGDSTISNESSLKKLKNFALAGQTPKAIVLCCSDSRAPVEMIFDQDIGDLFVIRVAGNIVAPSIIGSVEYAASTFGTPLVLVMGHSGCGAIAATVENILRPKAISSENIQNIVSRIRPHIATIAHIKGLTDEHIMDLCVEANVRASVANLANGSRIIENLIRSDKLMIVGATLNLETGLVSIIKD